MNQKKSKRERKQQTGNTVVVPKDKTNVVTNVVIGCVIAAFLGLGGYAVGTKIAEDRANAPAEEDAFQIETINEAAANEGISISEYLEKYGLPEDLSGSTSVAEAYELMTIENMAKVSGLTVEEFRASNFIPESITNDTKWGEAVPELPFKAIVGEEQVAQFKSIYGLGDDITADTKWKEVEPVLEAKRQELEAAMANANAGESSEEADSEDKEDADKEENKAEEE